MKFCNIKPENISYNLIYCVVRSNHCFHLSFHIIRNYSSVAEKYTELTN